MIQSDRPLHPLAQEELTQLEMFLTSDQTPEDCMSSLEMIDGYMTAIVIGPEAISQEQWIPYLLNPEKQQQDIFDSPEQASEISDLLTRHIDAIASQFVNDPEEFLPLYEMFSYSEDNERELAIEEWALGFILGMELSHEAWQPLFANEESAMLAGPLFILGRITDDYETMSQDERDEMTNMLDEAVIRIYEFWSRQD
ncbi:MAG: YecA family protein [Chlorobiaceae bacterium]|nr:YecA family protein [Chlorobiaceae bacterium]